MNNSRRAFITLVAAFVALTVLPSSAAAAGKFRFRPRANVMTTSLYRHHAQTQMKRNVAGIASRTRTRMMSVGHRRNMMFNVDQGVRLINQRIDAYGRDGRITASERTQILTLANAISADLRRNYRNVDSFKLL